MDHYLNEFNQSLNFEFWEQFGYKKEEKTLPSNFGMFVKRRWRKLSYLKREVDENYPPESWKCEDDETSNIDSCQDDENLDKFKKFHYIITENTKM